MPHAHQRHFVGWIQSCFGAVPHRRKREKLPCGNTKLSVEQLEPIEPLAGNIFASMSATGTLLLRGDAKDNIAEVHHVQVNGQTATAVQGLSGTTINNAPSATIFNVQAIDAVFARGDDSFAMDNVIVPGAIHIDTGPNFDVIALNNVAAASIVLDTGAGDDQVTAAAVTSETFVSDLGDGNNNFYLSQSTIGTVGVNAGTNNDSILVQSSRIDAMHFNLGAGRDSLVVNYTRGRNAAATNEIKASLGDDRDTFNMTGVRAKIVQIRGGRGVDTSNFDAKLNSIDNFKQLSFGV